MAQSHFKHRWQHPSALLALMLILLLLKTADVLASDGGFSDPHKSFFIQSFGDMPEELRSAREQGKQGILLFFAADGCRYCKAMLDGVLSQQKVQDWYRSRFVSIAVDIHGDVDLKDFDGITLPEKVFAEHRRVFMTPTISFIDLDGAEIYRHTGMVKTGEEFLIMGEYIAGKHYFDTEFKTYAKKRGAQNPGDVLVTPASESTNYDTETNTGG
jgi:thioredoxin-related protein